MSRPANVNKTLCSATAVRRLWRVAGVAVLALAMGVTACSSADSVPEGASSPSDTQTGEISTADASTTESEAPTSTDVGDTASEVEPATGRGARAAADTDTATTQSGGSDASASETPTSTPTDAASSAAEADDADTATAEPAATEADDTDAATAEPAATEADDTDTATAEPTATEVPVVEGPAQPIYFETIPAGNPLPTEEECAAMVRAVPLAETHSQNQTPNATAGGPSVRIDGADEYWNGVLAPRITGNFTGSTEELIRWAACKWGFDEDLTRARAWTESSWRVGTEGDRTSNTEACRYLELANPCYQSYGLLQVKGTVHQGTYPHAHESSAWGLDYAMAWQRACLEGSFEWLNASGYVANDVQGCVGAWYSGEWYDSNAMGYLQDVDNNLTGRPWD